MILHEGAIDKRVQYLIEGVTKVRALKFEGHAAVPPGLDLIDEGDQITHQVDLEGTPLDAQARPPAPAAPPSPRLSLAAGPLWRTVGVCGGAPPGLRLPPAAGALFAACTDQVEQLLSLRAGGRAAARARASADWAWRGLAWWVPTAGVRDARADAAGRVSGGRRVCGARARVRGARRPRLRPAHSCPGAPSREVARDGAGRSACAAARGSLHPRQRSSRLEL